MLPYKFLSKFALLIAVIGTYAGTIRGEKGWIVAGSINLLGIEAGVLCNLFSLNVLGTPYSFSDQAAPAEGLCVALYMAAFLASDWNAVWVYNESTRAIQIMWLPDGKEYCLKYTDPAKYCSTETFSLTIDNCNISNPYMQWTLEQNTMDTVRIRSGVLSASGHPLYLSAELYSLSSNPYSPRRLFMYEDGIADPSQYMFAFLASPASDTMSYSAMVAMSQPCRGQDDNMICNGGFDSTGLPTRSNSNTHDNTLVLQEGEPYICSWSVFSGSVSLLDNTLFSWPNAAYYGPNSLVLANHSEISPIKDSMIAQYVFTEPNSPYSLSFYLSTSLQCDHKERTTTVVEFTPSDASSQGQRYEIQLMMTNEENVMLSPEAATSSYRFVVINFTAASNVTRISFLSNATVNWPTICAPVIDEVSLVIGSQQLYSSSHDGSKGIEIAAIVVGSVLGFISICVIVLAYFAFCYQPVARAKPKRADLSSSKDGKVPVTTLTFSSDYANSSADNIGAVETYSLEELREATANFTTKVGQGGFGVVYKATLRNGTVGAVKRAMHKGWLTDQRVFMQELSVLLRLRHLCLVNLQGFCCEKGEHILVFDYVENGSLYDRLHTTQGRAKQLTWEARVGIAINVGSALEYLHHRARPPIIHRDIKSANVLLTENDNGRLADLGLSKVGWCHKTSTPVKGSMGYTDPHYVWTGILSQASDIYSYGVLLLELITGRKAMQGTQTLAEWSLPYRHPQVSAITVSGSSQSLTSSLSSSLSSSSFVPITAPCIIGDNNAVRTSMVDVLDPSLLVGEDGKQGFDLDELTALTNICNLCLKDDPQSRPTMIEILGFLGCTIGTVHSASVQYDAPFPTKNVLFPLTSTQQP